MRRFLLFVGEKYYPAGGWKDFIEAYETIEKALEGWKKIEMREGDWASGYLWHHIVDTKTGRIIPEK